jgi:hypothetical protein
MKKEKELSYTKELTLMSEKIEKSLKHYLDQQFKQKSFKLEQELKKIVMGISEKHHQNNLHNFIGKMDNEALVNDKSFSASTKQVFDLVISKVNKIIP